MNDRCFCGNCFSQIPPNGGRCANCGFDNAEARNISGCLMPGTALNGRYLVGRRLGAGGFGITYKCFDTRIGGVCAIKEYLPTYIAMRVGHDPNISVTQDNLPKYKEVLGKFMNEAELVKSLNQKNIVKVYDSFFQNNTAYYVMEYCDGKDLREYTDSFRRTLSYEEGMNILKQVMDGLEYIHQNSVLHRDIAPDNIFVTGSGMVKLLDFGAARREMMQSNRELTGFVKVGYAPVEQYGGLGAQGPFTDIYALGATFYCLFTGKMPTESTARVESDPLVPLSALRPDLPDNLKYCIEKCMAVRVSQRVQNIAEMKQILGLAGPAPVPTPGATPVPTPGPTPAPHPISSVPQRVAGKGKRFVGVLLDTLIWMPFVVAIAQANPLLTLLFPPVIILLHSLLETQMGATLGKLILRLRIVNDRNEYPSFGQALIRNVVKLLGVFVVILANGNLLLEDTQSGTKVVCL